MTAYIGIDWGQAKYARRAQRRRTPDTALRPHTIVPEAEWEWVQVLRLKPELRP